MIKLICDHITQYIWIIELYTYTCDHIAQYSLFQLQSSWTENKLCSKREVRIGGIKLIYKIFLICGYITWYLYVII